MNVRQPSKRRILIVDDQKGITNLWKVLLEKTGHYIVREENNSSQAVWMARVFRPHLMLLDMDMPDLNGSEVAAGVRAVGPLDGTAIVFLTSLVTPREVASGRRIAGYPCVAKPSSLEELVQVIEESLSPACLA